MIAKLSGRLDATGEDWAVVDVGGVRIAWERCGGGDEDCDGLVDDAVREQVAEEHRLPVDHRRARAVEVGDATVPALQKKMIRMARDRNKLTITATAKPTAS